MAAEPPAGVPLHPPRLIHDNPLIWEFAAPIGGTYPLAYDPALLIPKKTTADEALAVLDAASSTLAQAVMTTTGSVSSRASIFARRSSPIHYWRWGRR